MKNKLIMIIDDDLDDIDFFCEDVKKVEIDVACLSFNMPDKALDYLGNEECLKPNWIFLDINMPKINGIECLKRIKQMPHLQDVPVIIYTTCKTQNNRDQIKELGANGYLVKPDSFDGIKTELQKWMV